MALIGPGMLIAATGVGAGDLAAAGIAGSELGVAVLWAVVLGALAKLVLTEGLARWQLATGSTLLEGAVHRIGLGVGVLFFLYLLPWTFFTGGALINAAGVAGDALVPVFEPLTRDDGTVFNTGKVVFGIAQSLIGLGLVWVGGFKLFERVMAVCIGLMFAAVVVTAVLTGPDWAAVARGLVVPTIPDWRGEGLRLTVALLGGVGGTVTILCYGYWIREQGREGAGQVRACRIDLGAGYAMTALFGAATLIIASGVEVDGRGAGLLVAMGGRLRGAIGGLAGDAARWLFLLGCWAAIFSSLLGVWQAVPYLFADLSGICRRRLAGEPVESREPVNTRGRVYRGTMIALATAPIVLLWTGFRQAVLYYTLCGAAFIPMLALVLLIMNSVPSWIGREQRNRWRSVALLVAALALSSVAGWFLAVTTIEKLRAEPVPTAAPDVSATPAPPS